MPIKQSERNITVILFFLAILVFTLAQEQSRVIERAYSGRTNLHTANPLKPSSTPMAGLAQQTPVKTH